MVMRWHADKELYEKECAKYPGFLTVLRAANSDKASLLGFENFRHVCHKWQYKLTKAVVVCLESKDYTQIRNTILVLIKILPHYPQVKNLGQAVERRVDKIIEDEKDKRHDLQALAIGYNGMLKRKADMVPENQFHQKDKEKVEVKNAKPAGKQEAAEESTARGSIKREEVEDLTSNSDGYTKSSKSDASVARSDRERLVEEESNDRKRAQSGSPKNSSSNSAKIPDSKDRPREKSKDRLKDSKDKDKRRSRTASPPSGSEDLKKRRLDEDGFHSPNASKSKEKSKNDRKRSSMDNNLDMKDSKRKKAEIDLTNSNSDKLKKDVIKKEKVKSKEKSTVREDFKPSKKDSKVDGRKEKDSRDEEKSKKHKTSKMKDR
jgi:THO complex subunit 2